VISELGVLGLSLCSTFILWRAYRQRPDAKSWLVLKIVGNLVFVIAVAALFFLHASVEFTAVGLTIVLCLRVVATFRAVKQARNDVDKSCD